MKLIITMGSSRSSSGGVVSELDDPSLSLSKLLNVLYSIHKSNNSINQIYLNYIQINMKLTSGVLAGDLLNSGICRRVAGR